MFLLVYHRIALLASTYSRGKGVCLFSFIVPELDRATYVCHDLLTKLGVTLGAWPETGARYPLPRLRDVCRSGPVVTSSEVLIGAEGETVSWQGSEGRVRVKGEIWLTRSTLPLRPGAASRSPAATASSRRRYSACLAVVALIPTQSGNQRIALS